MKIESKPFNILCLCAVLVAFAFSATLFSGEPRHFTTGQVAIEAPLGELNGNGAVGLPDLKIFAEQWIDGLDYQLGFPWPNSSDGQGPSMELMHPDIRMSLSLRNAMIISRSKGV